MVCFKEMNGFKLYCHSPKTGKRERERERKKESEKKRVKKRE